LNIKRKKAKEKNQQLFYKEKQRYKQKNKDTNRKVKFINCIKKKFYIPKLKQNK